MAHVEGAQTVARDVLRRRRRRRMWRAARAVLKHAVLLSVATLLIIPVYWMVIAIFKNTDQIFAQPPIWFPHPFITGNIAATLTYPGFPFLRFLGNSLFYAGTVTLGTVLSCAGAGYGFARLRFPGRSVLFAITIATLMIPGIVTFIPTYILFKYLHLLGSYAPLIVPNFFGNAFFIFMLRQFYMGLPWELSEAATVDGASEWRIFWNIMLPLVRPALIVVAVFTFVWTWQDFFGPLVYLDNPSSYPLSLGLYAFHSQHTTDWPLLMTAATLTTLPLVLLFFATQRYFVQGITLTGLKG